MENIKQIYRDENTVLFSDGTYTLKIIRVQGDTPEESFEACGEWVGEDLNPCNMIGMYLFVYFRDFYEYNTRGEKTVNREFQRHWRFAERARERAAEREKNIQKININELRSIIKKSVEDFFDNKNYLY